MQPIEQVVVKRRSSTYSTFMAGLANLGNSGAQVAIDATVGDATVAMNLGDSAERHDCIWRQL